MDFTKGILLDKYDRRARLRPALLVALPIAAAAVAWFPGDSFVWGSLVGLVVWSGGAALLAQLGRGLGKKQEPILYKSWGGKPTTYMLRHTGGSNRIQRVRWHEKLTNLLTDISIPSIEEENRDPESADQVYDTCVAYVRERTRDKEEFALVFEENCNYGFRRNLYGMRYVGMVSAVLGLAAAVSLIVLSYSKTGLFVDPTAWGVGLLSILLLVFFAGIVTSDWVKTQADTYAIRLLESIERL